MKRLFLLYSLIALSSFSQAQNSSTLFTTLLQKDSLLFTVGFNGCDLKQVEASLSEDFEFYHDQAGVTSSKTDFINQIKNNICGLPYRPKRILVKPSMQVFPLLNNNIVYGAIQSGDHQFYAIEPNGKEYLTSTAKFTHLWLLEKGEFKLAKALSYDHVNAPQPKEEVKSEPKKNETQIATVTKSSPADFGYKHLQLQFHSDTVDVLLKIKPGDENKVKPLFFFCQGSLPIPLLITENNQAYPVFPFSTDALCENYHVVIVNKPGIPLFCASSALQNNLTYIDPATQQPPKAYLKNNNLEYYVQRNLAVVSHLLKQKYIDKTSCVVAGHSQGARIAFEMALHNSKITHLIYASGNPCGQITAMVAKARHYEKPDDAATHAQNEFSYYEQTVNHPTSDEDKSTYSFSKSSIPDFPKLKQKVLVCYGTKDVSAPYNDYLQTETIRQKKSNFTYKPYIGLEHNFFGSKPNGDIDYDQYHWDDVANDWLKWLGTK